MRQIFTDGVKKRNTYFDDFADQIIIDPTKTTIYAYQTSLYLDQLNTKLICEFLEAIN